MNKRTRADGKLLDLLITGARVVDPVSGGEQVADILVTDGKVEAIAATIPPAGRTVVDARGLLAMPGLLDMHVHLREPGQEWKEDIESGSAAAAAGGFVVVCAMPNTEPAVDSAQMIRFVRERGQEANLITVLPIGTVTKQRRGEQLAPIGEMVEAGAVGVSDDGDPVADAELMMYALQYVKPFGVPVIAHCEEQQLTRGGQMNYGFISAKLGLRGMPVEAEQAAIARDLGLARLTGSHLHITHVSSAGSVDLIRTAKHCGIKVTADVTPHHLTLTEQEIADRPYDTSTKVNPPLRTDQDIQALTAGLVDSTIDVIATDHAPHHEDDKNVEYGVADFGISGLETAWPVIYTYLVVPGKITLVEAVQKMTINPARIIGCDRGRFTIGALVDLCLVDPEQELTCDPTGFLSKGKNTPFAGRSLVGWPAATISQGKLVFSSGRLRELETAGGWE